MVDHHLYGIPQLTYPPRRVVSLVPSLTESLFDLGLGEAVVGITDYCVHPIDRLQGVKRLGGTKDPQIDQIIALKPDLILANQEENRPETIQALEREGLHVWVSFPKTIREVLDLLWEMVKLFRSSESAQRLRQLETVVQWAVQAAATQKKQRYFCPIWQDKTSNGECWWMTFNQETYPSDLLANMGGENIFKDRNRRFPLDADLGRGDPEDPGERDTRYPRVIVEEILQKDPEIIFLPDEPFEYSSAQKAEISKLLEGTAAVRNDQIYLIEGSLITWHGTRMSRAFREIPRYFS
jgi:ABC-type Fe3+-hydroxamate transport system substrate-binding protein